MKRRWLVNLLATGLTLAGLAGSCIVTPIPPPNDRAFFCFIRDAVTGEPVDNAIVIATTGEYRTWLIGGFEASGNYSGGYSPGTYTITVQAEGYAPYVKEGIVVEADQAPGWADYAGLRPADLTVIHLAPVD